MSHSPPPSDAQPTWARQIQAKYHCVLPPDLTDWFDGEIWRGIAQRPQANAFSQPIAPDQLLVDAPESIWPALMPCDFLPVIGNGLGDWLCLRIGANDEVTEVVHWYHGGGDWIPWGASLSEAILFDHLRSNLPGFSRDHAIAADETSVFEDDVPASDGRDVQRMGCDLVRWAASHVSDSNRFLENHWKGKRLADELLTIDGLTAAVCCQLVIDALQNPMLDEKAISELASDESEVQRWLFDNRLIADGVQTLIANEIGVDREKVFNKQRWGDVYELCESVTKVSPHLGWAWELCGYAAERTGRVDEAVTFYRKGATCSIFGDQAVRLRTHGFEGDGQKFSVTRLTELGFRCQEETEREYLSHLSIQPTDDRREQVRLHFCGLAELAEKAGDYGTAFEYWMRAGWDLGAEPMIAFADLLDHVACAAESSGRGAQAALARTHRACFKDRYRI